MSADVAKHWTAESEQRWTKQQSKCRRSCVRIYFQAAREAVGDGGESIFARTISRPIWNCVLRYLGSIHVEFIHFFVRPAPWRAGSYDSTLPMLSLYVRGPYYGELRHAATCCDNDVGGTAPLECRCISTAASLVVVASDHRQHCSVWRSLLGAMRGSSLPNCPAAPTKLADDTRLNAVWRLSTEYAGLDICTVSHCRLYQGGCLAVLCQQDSSLTKARPFSSS